MRLLSKDDFIKISEDELIWRTIIGKVGKNGQIWLDETERDHPDFQHADGQVK